MQQEKREERKKHGSNEKSGVTEATPLDCNYRLEVELHGQLHRSVSELIARNTEVLVFILAVFTQLFELVDQVCRAGSPAPVPLARASNTDDGARTIIQGECALYLTGEIEV